MTYSRIVQVCAVQVQQMSLNSQSPMQGVS